MGAELFSLQRKLMGNAFTFSVVMDFKAEADCLLEAAVAETRRIECLFTTYDQSSETSRINASAGVAPVAVSDEVYGLIERSLAISRITQGAFDISYGGLDKSLWNFDTHMDRLPDAETARKMIHLIDYRNIELDPEEKTVFLRQKGMRIGFGGIGKGYAAEKVKQLLKREGVTSGIVNAAGDLCTWGNQPGGKPWTIGIAHPDRPELAFSSLEISDKAIATSGNYEKFVEIGGQKYSHTIDPNTGLPVRGIKSVTIIAPNAEFADALATPVSVMGIRAGLFLIDQIPDVHAIVIDDHNQMFTSKQIHLT